MTYKGVLVLCLRCVVCLSFMQEAYPIISGLTRACDTHLPGDESARMSRTRHDGGLVWCVVPLPGKNCTA